MNHKLSNLINLEPICYLEVSKLFVILLWQLKVKVLKHENILLVFSFC
jgi:hypothetical protein